LELKENKMEKLVIIGGAKGVGKSTLIQRLIKIKPMRIVNTGEIVISALNKKLDPEEKIKGYLLENSTDLIMDTHYAGYTPHGFIRGLSTKSLHTIKEAKSIDLILLDLDTQSLIKRRTEDENKKRIPPSGFSAETELEMNRVYFREYCKDLSMPGITLINYNLNKTLEQVINWIK